MRSILLHSGLAALAAFLPNWHWTNRALEPSSPAPKSSESREGGRRRVRWLAFRSSCSPILVPGLAARGSSTPWACALRGERRLGEGVVCGQDGGDCSRCGPIRGRGVAAKGTAEGPTGENRTQGEECPVRAVAEDKEDGEPNTKQLREGEEEGEKHRELRLRNYVPEDEDLKKRRVPQAKPVAVEEKVKEQLEAAKPEPVIEEVDLANLAPRKPDWDLKRDVAKKLEKLEKRTQRAIAELIRERLKGQEENLASAVATTAATEPEACDSD
ncbi:coiled-coil domain-containing protein 12 isoform X1 [Bos javanicus]|uniref:coiled-coil domain-containing protein 12 isoform X1 n=1 Tax=Bos javanicus TaxID=9906 RepID=UPI002AA68E8D|nr:coiled-coil domain-containing protein 12 isoform X1 [Bos javanicus]